MDGDGAGKRVDPKRKGSVLGGCDGVCQCRGSLVTEWEEQAAGRGWGVEIESGGWKKGSRDQRLLHFAARQLTPEFLFLNHSLLQKR